ncbi:MAG: hypothetical protein GX455_06310 [Phycisphaerae bacterium]|nr:hypothetical protein [Phycisphaerae bacterium]
MKKCLIIMMLFSMGLAGVASAGRGNFKYYRWNFTSSTNPSGLSAYQRDLSLTPKPNNTYTVTTGYSFYSSNTAATLCVETPTWANGDYYQARFDGWLLPPADGKYTFYIDSDDQSELWLSSDDQAANVGTTPICSVSSNSPQRQWDKLAGQKSAEITLEAGKAYFFYAIWRDGSGGDGCALGWSCPEAGIPNPVVIERFYVTDETASIIPGLSKFPGAVEYELWQKPDWYTASNNANTAVWTTLMSSDNGATWRLPPNVADLGDPTYTGTFDLFTVGYSNRFVYRQYGILQVPEDGILSFAITSDDGSRLYVGDWWTPGAPLTHVVNNDGSHGMQLRYGSIPVKAGYVGVVIYNFQGTGGVGLQAYYYNDTIPYQEIPVSALYSRNVACRYSPAQDVRNLPIDSVLSWSQPVFKSITSNTLYLGKVGEPMTNVYEGLDTSFAPTLEANTKYRWRVDVSEPNLADGSTIVTAGPTWGFATGSTYSTAITITTQPIPVAFDSLGGSAKFVIAATCSKPLTYQWYKDGGLIDGATGTEFMVDPVEADDLGGYYCVVSNGNAAEDKTSNTARIALKKLMAYYPFDADAADASGNGHDGTMVTRNADPTKLPGFVTGVKGQAMQFNGVDQYVNAGTWNPSEDSGQLTISMWARWEPTSLGVTTAAGDRYQGIIGKRLAWNATDSYWQIEMAQQATADTNINRSHPYIGGLSRNGASTGNYFGYLRHMQGIDRTEFGTASASKQNPTAEGVAQAFDSNQDTKWLARANKAWIAYDFPGDAAYVIGAYALTTANDNTGRDPKSWTLQGSNDGGVTWTVLDTQTGITLGDTRKITLNYTVTNPGSYKMYKLDITEARDPSLNMLQLADLQLFELVDPSAKWVHIATTYDGQTSKLFINGVQRVSSTGFSFGPKTDAFICIGGGELHADGSYANRFMGSIDEVRLYNYGMTNMEVAALYASEGGSSVCGVNPQYDFNGNCMVDLDDLMLFMSKWLSCNELGAGACD